MIAEEMWTVRT